MTYSVKRERDPTGLEVDPNIGTIRQSRASDVTLASSLSSVETWGCATTYPEETLRRAQNFCRNAESRVVWMVESLNPFPNMMDK